MLLTGRLHHIGGWILPSARRQRWVTHLIQMDPSSAAGGCGGGLTSAPIFSPVAGAAQPRMPPPKQERHRSYTQYAADRRGEPGKPVIGQGVEHDQAAPRKNRNPITSPSHTPIRSEGFREARCASHTSGVLEHEEYHEVRKGEPS